MKAVVKTKRGDGFVELLDVKDPKAGAQEYLVGVGYCGVCGSDLNILHDRFPGYVVPVIMGHEFAGTIEEGPEKGRRVACETHAYICNECDYCRSGLYNLCQNRKGFGYGVDGAFTKLVRVRKPIVHDLPEGISMEEGAVLEPLSVAVNALTVNSKISDGESVVILGPGPIGLLCLQVAKLSGAKVTVVGTETSGDRLRLAGKFGAQTMTDGELARKLEGTSGLFDVAVIAAGRTSTFETALRAVKPGRRVVQVGESTDKASFQFSLLEKKNITVIGSFSHNWPVWEKAISLVKDGKVDLKPLITHRLPIESWKEGFDTAEGRRGVKVLLRP